MKEEGEVHENVGLKLLLTSPNQFQSKTACISVTCPFMTAKIDDLAM